MRAEKTLSTTGSGESVGGIIGQGLDSLLHGRVAGPQVVHGYAIRKLVGFLDETAFGRDGRVFVRLHRQLGAALPVIAMRWVLISRHSQYVVIVVCNLLVDASAIIVPCLKINARRQVEIADEVAVVQAPPRVRVGVVGT